MFVAIDRTSKFAFVELHERATRQIVSDFLRYLIKAVPYGIHLTGNGIQRQCRMVVLLVRKVLDKGELVRAHIFEYA